VETELNRISEIAKKDKKLKFTCLSHLMSKESLAACFYLLKGGKASGVDKVSLEDYEADLENNLCKLEKKLKQKSYKPQPVRRVYIPKTNGKLRPLGIPAVEDKIVQMAVTRMLNAIYEQDFLDCSFGFRVKKGCHDALKAIDRMIMQNPVNYVIDADIKGFFDNVDHEWLLKMLEVRIADRTLLQLIKRFLKGGVMEDGKLYSSEKGTPQGGILSPVLANIYLHYALDEWIKYNHLKAEGYIGMVRYADDFVICAKTWKEVRKLLENLKTRLAKFKLELAEDKTRLIEFGRFARRERNEIGKRVETFNFLGLTHYCGISRKGKFKIGRITEKKKLQQKIKGISEWLREVIHSDIREWWEKLRSKIIGHYQYFGISDNIRGINHFYHLVRGIVFKMLNSRSQKSSFNWEEFLNYARTYKLPVPKIYHNFYSS
jgi:RNA-directed DNA polymerase